jgi:hypothetical protein
VRASPAPEPSLGLASHVNLERLVRGLVQHCKHGGVRVISDGGNLAVVELEVRSGRKEGSDVGNELPRLGEVPCRWHLWGCCHCGNQKVDTRDRLLDKCRVSRKNSLSNRFPFEETKGGMASQRKRCCMPRVSGTGRLHEGDIIPDIDNGVRMRCGIIKSEIEKIQGGVPARRYK